MEKNSEPKKGLLEMLAGKTGCMYLSDLHIKKRLSYIYYAVSEIPAESYPLSEWESALRYIAGIDDTFHTEEEARALLLHYAWEEQSAEETE